MPESIHIRLDSEAIEEAFEEWLAEVHYAGEVEVGSDGLPVLRPEPDDPDDDYGPLEAKHGDPKRDPVGYQLLHPRRTRGFETGDRFVGDQGQRFTIIDRNENRVLVRRDDDGQEIAVGPTEIGYMDPATETDHAVGESVLWRGERYKVVSTHKRFYQLRHVTTRSTLSVPRGEVLADTPENLESQTNDPHYVATKRLEEVTGAEINIWRIAPELVEPLVETVTAEFERHPRLRGFVHRIEAVELFERARYAQWHMIDRALSMNTWWVGNARVQDLRESLRRNAEDGLHPRSLTDPMGLVIHEIGHALHQLAQYSPLEGRDQPFFDLALKERLAEAGITTSRIGGHTIEMRQRLASEVSAYGAADWDEMVAEAYADYRLPAPEQSALATMIGKLLDEWQTEQDKLDRSEKSYTGDMEVKHGDKGEPGYEMLHPGNRSIAEALKGMDLPTCARDGDCIPVSGGILTKLKAEGFQASLATVWGWVEPNVVGFAHNAVWVESDDGPVIVDATATQFEATLPPLIIAPLDEYVARMAKATRVSSVTVSGGPEQNGPTIKETPGSPLKYDRFNVTHRLSLIEGDGWHPDADIEDAKRRMGESYKKWRQAHPRVKRLERYTDASHWVKTGYAYFTADNSEPGTVAFVDLEVYPESGSVFVAYLSVRPDKRGQKLARRLMQETYDRWPDAKVYWGKIISDAMGHLYDDFKARYPDRTPHAKRDY